MRIERERFESEKSFKIRKDFIEKFMIGKRNTEGNKTTALVYSNILRNMVLLGCKYEEKVEREVKKINNNK